MFSETFTRLSGAFTHGDAFKQFGNRKMEAIDEEVQKRITPGVDVKVELSTWGEGAFMVPKVVDNRSMWDQWRGRGEVTVEGGLLSGYPFKTFENGDLTEINENVRREAVVLRVQLCALDPLYVTKVPVCVVLTCATVGGLLLKKVPVRSLPLAAGTVATVAVSVIADSLINTYIVGRRVASMSTPEERIDLAKNVVHWNPLVRWVPGAGALSNALWRRAFQ